MGSQRIQAVRGMHDVLPDRSPLWNHIEATAQSVLSAYGYDEIRLPIVEKTDLFQRAIGEVTDIVEKEMYSFDDRNGDSLTLRPEGTAGCVRAGIEHGLVQGQPQRLWYRGAMFRHERPQKGRYRQFHQIGVETFGMIGPDIDAELILLSARLWRALGLDGLRLEINTLGEPEARRAYREALVAYLTRHVDALDEDSRRRLSRNPLRVLDSKDPGTQAVLVDAPTLSDFLDAESLQHFEVLQAQLEKAGITCHWNPRLVRGLDYYNRTVFEWITDRLGAQGTVCAGGRYDGLVSQLGGPPTPAAGFALGLERLVALLEEDGVTADQSPHAYLLTVGDAARHTGLQLGEALRDALPGLRLVTYCGTGGMRNQFKRADRSGAQVALILAEEELAQQAVSIKPLRGGEQFTVPVAEVAEHLRRLLQDNGAAAATK